MFGLPLELFSLAGGWLMGFLNKRHQDNMDNRKLELEILQVQHNIDQELREGPKRGNKEFQWTRRFLAIGCFLTVMVLPKIAVFFGVPLIYAYDSVTGGFLWFDPSTQQNFSIVKGIIYLPYESHIISAVFGLYFGKSK